MSYSEAIRILSTRHRLVLKQPSGISNNVGMNKWLKDLGCEKLRFGIIHVTGTKGKGSTCSFVEAFVRKHFQHQSKPFKTGLYTSPQVFSECDRIRINSEPVPEKQFAQHFFEIWDILKKQDHRPGYLQLLALLSLYTFQKECVDLAVYEVHAGGRKDATNVFDNPIACGFTTIGLDHVQMLGPHIENIAWHKAGIMKPGSPAFSVPQAEPVRHMLEEQASSCSLSFIRHDARLADRQDLQHVQRWNISLAICLGNAYLSSFDDILSDKDIDEGIHQHKWPGRFQHILDGADNWYLDFAHNTLSLPVALRWFYDQVEPKKQGSVQRILIFGHESRRDTTDLVNIMIQYCNEYGLHFDLVILTAYKLRVVGEIVFQKTVALQHIEAWRSVSTNAICVGSVTEAIALAKQDSPFQALIVGSSHLVSNFLGVFNK